jgi:hypothetical protein
MSCPENGFELASQIFGGFVETSPDLNLSLPLETNFPKRRCTRVKPNPYGSVPVGPMVTLSEWPSTGFTATYVASGDVRADFKPAATLDAHSRVPFSYLEDLFSQKFWDKVQAEGPEVLKPPSRGIWFFH